MSDVIGRGEDALERESGNIDLSSFNSERSLHCLWLQATRQREGGRCRGRYSQGRFARQAMTILSMTWAWIVICATFCQFGLGFRRFLTAKPAQGHAGQSSVNLFDLSCFDRYSRIAVFHKNFNCPLIP